jgi:hypothetical protein
LPNPSGVNSFDRFASEASYGAKQRLSDLERSSPVPGAGPLNAPRRAKRHATGQDQARQASPGAPVAAPPPTFEPSPQALGAEVWRELAQHPDASPLVKQYAAEQDG